jgi:hypothetical protein
MRTYKITTRTPAEISAAFAACSKDVRPITRARPPTAAEWLAPYRTEIMKLRRRGLTWDQISGIMANPQIGEQVSAKLLRRVFAPKSKSSSAAPATPYKPHTDRIVIDPLTGKVTTLPVTAR